MKQELSTTEATSRVPIPDPTELTTKALQDAIDNLKELTMVKITDLEKIMETKIANTNALKEEKFKELHERLAMVERHRIEAKADDSQALAAALASQKELFKQTNECNEEASAKAEASFTKQLESIRKEGVIEREALSGRIDALKERIDRGAGKETQQTENRGQQNWLIGTILGAAAIVISVIAMLMRPAAPAVQIKDSGPTSVPAQVR